MVLFFLNVHFLLLAVILDSHITSYVVAQMPEQIPYFEINLLFDGISTFRIGGFQKILSLDLRSFCDFRKIHKNSISEMAVCL